MVVKNIEDTNSKCLYKTIMLYEEIFTNYFSILSKAINVKVEDISKLLLEKKQNILGEPKLVFYNDRLIGLFSYFDFNELKLRQMNTLMILKKQFSGFNLNDLSEYSKELALYNSKRKSVYIGAIGVFNKYRGQKYGKKILDALIDMVKNDGYSEIVLHVHIDNHLAINLYTENGFIQINKDTKFIYIIMTKDI